MNSFNELKDSEATNVENKKDITEEKDYSPIIEIAAIISNNDPQVVEDMTLFVTDIKSFVDKYDDWCEELDINDKDDKDDVLYTVAFGLTGYNTDYTYGHYIDWNEETETILYGLEIAIKKLGYPLKVDNIEFTDEEFTDEALDKINDHFMKSGYTLFNLDIGNDCYHLFITTLEKFNRVCELGEALDFNFYNTYQ